MPNTYKKIASVTVGSGGAASIDFTSIPQTYTDLKVVVSGRASADNPTLIYYFNNDTTTANYTFRNVNGNGSTAASNSATQPWISAGITPSSATASVFANTEIYIPNYTSANLKSVSSDSVTENNATAAYSAIWSGLWSSTAAITRITLDPYGGDFAQYTTATLYGIGDVTASKFAKATGGVITYDANYVYHTYPYSGTFTPNTALTVDYLVVAGGGGGGGTQGGGGGAGGLRCTVGATGGGGSLESQLAVTAQAYTVTVGAGGNGGANAGSNGSNSVFGSITSTGGGGGGYYGNPNGFAGATGGSGGGGGGAENGTVGNGGAGTSNQGYAGGAGFNRAASGTYGTAGGGGGAGAVGQAGARSTDSADGGNGVTTSISGTSTTYAGGGGGWISNVPYTGAGIGGTGGGGNGGNTSGATAGTANTGGGGGGVNTTTGAAGGSGIVIIRYPR